jgi:hypothetical protein
VLSLLELTVSFSTRTESGYLVKSFAEQIVSATVVGSIPTESLNLCEPS